MIPFLKKNKDGKKPPKSTVPRKTKNSGTPTTAAAPKQISCRAVRLKATLDFTLLKSRGTEI